MLTYDIAGSPETWDPKLAAIGQTNLGMRTSNGYSPHLYPEYIVDRECYYGAAPRPGFMSRFLVAESGSRAPYWPTTRTNFGGQIGAGINGDLPGDIYRLLGGVVLSRAGEAPLYAPYMAGAFIQPSGSKSDRVVAPGSEDLLGPTGEKAPFFLVGLRPGTAMERGAVLTASAQIDPILPVKIKFTLTYPDGSKKSREGMSDSFDPVAMNKAAPIYDLSNPYSGKQDESRLVHLSFFGLKKDAEGRTQGYVDRVIIRGREVISAR